MKSYVTILSDINQTSVSLCKGVNKRMFGLKTTNTALILIITLIVSLFTRAK